MNYNTDDLKKYYASNKHSTSVVWPDFHRRAKRRQKLALNQLQEDELNDCLNLSAECFKTKYRVRKTVAYIEDKQIILNDFYIQVSTSKVTYNCFRLRSLRLK